MSTERTLDVRDVDGEPFGHIMSELGELEEGETLELVNSFEPVPLYDVLADRGFEYESEQAGPDEWRVLIRHD